MALLVGYDSSDDDGEETQLHQSPQEAGSVQARELSREPLLSKKGEPGIVQTDAPALPPAPAPLHAAQSPPTGPSLPTDAAAIGPTLPPTEATDAYPEEMDQDGLNPHPSQATPSSPYSANRSLIHTLTLPTVPNMDIPPSPPGSPSLSEPQAALTAKFDKFLELKRKKGTHFNARIADSHALKNPPLMDKLLEFAGVGVAFEDGSIEGPEQYATTLPTDLWDPAAFPSWAYRGPLRKAQEKVRKERGRDKGEAVHFVPASS
ncbi:unnamed protein product [Discula destructiva]